MKRRLKITIISGIILCFVGTVGVVQTLLTTSAGIAQAQSFTAQQTQSTPVQPQQQAISGHPANISFPSVGINLPVIDGVYNPNTKDWTLTPNKAQYAAITSQPNNVGGNTFIYGHALPQVFGNLPNIKAGDKALVTTDNGYTFTYVFQHSIEVPPTDTSLFGYKGAPILTVQTCSGTWYQNRQLFTFTLQSVAKS